jgi:hypothetical protein
VVFSVGINGGQDLGPLPSGFMVNGESADIPVDTVPPSTPMNISVSYTGAQQTLLSWDASTDNILVAGYNIAYANNTGSWTTSTSTTDVILTGLVPDTNYTAIVTAVDIAGNLSAPSTTELFTTLPALPDEGAYLFSVAPFIDYMAWPQLTAMDCYQSTGVLNYILAFIVAGTAADGSIFPAWGGQNDPAYDARTTSFGKDDIQSLRDAGGDVSISFGGEAGSILEEMVTDINTLVGMYQGIIDNYQLNCIDFDFEGSALGETDALTRHILVIEAILRANPFLQVSYTLPVDAQSDPTSQGLSPVGQTFVGMLASAGIVPSMINGMTMYFGQTAPSDMFEGVKVALEALNSQVVATWPQLSEEQAWRRMGATPMFGENGTASENFTLENQSQLLAYAQQVNLGLLSGWSMNRDHDLFNWQYSTIIKDYQHQD